MTAQTDIRPDWAELWRSGALPRLCFISLGLTFHAGAENMISTIMPAMVRDIGGVQLTGWSFAIYEIGSILAGAATGRLCTYLDRAHQHDRGGTGFCAGNFCHGAVALNVVGARRQASQRLRRRSAHRALLRRGATLFRFTDMATAHGHPVGRLGR